MKDFKSMVKALAPYFDSHLVEIPKGLQDRIGNIFFMGWDALDSDQRRQVIIQWDYLNNPAAEADRGMVWAAEKRIREIDALLAAHEPSSDIFKNREQRTELSSLTAERAALELKFKPISAPVKHSLLNLELEPISELVESMSAPVEPISDIGNKYFWVPKVREIAVRLYIEAMEIGWGTDKSSIAKKVAAECATEKILTDKKKLPSAAYIERHALTPWNIPTLAQAKKQN